MKKFAIITVLVVLCTSAAFVIVVRRAKADPLPIKLNQEQQKRMFQMQLEEIQATQTYNQAMDGIRKRYQSLRNEVHAPADYINDMDGGLTVGFRPKKEELK